MSKEISQVVYSGMLWLSASSVAMKVIGITYTILVLSHLTVYQYGVVELILSIPALLGILNLPGLDAVISTDLSNEKGKGNHRQMQYIYGSYLSIRTILSIVAWLIMLAALPYVTSEYNTLMATMLFVLSFTFLSNPIRTKLLLVFQASLNYQHSALYRTIEELGKLLIVATCLLILDLGPLSVMLAYVGGEILSNLIMYPFYLRVKREFFGKPERLIGWNDPIFTIKAHGKWSIFGTYLDMFGQNIRPWFIKLFLGTHAVAIYAVAVGMYRNTYALLPFYQVVTPIMPRYVHDRLKLYPLINSSVKYQILTSIISSVLMAAFMPILIHVFFPHYAESYLLFLTLLLVGVPSSFGAVFQSAFFALKAQKSLFFANVIRLISVFIFMPPALYFGGLYGITAEFFLTRTIFAYNRYRGLCKLLPGYRLKFNDVFSITETDKMLFNKVTKSLKPRLPLSNRHG